VAEPPAAATATAFAPYRALLRSRIRAQRAYPLSFVADLLGASLTGAIEFAEVWVLFSNVKMLGGLDFKAMLLLFGLSNFSFAIADILAGHTDTLFNYIRQGTFDVFYLRPQPLLLQLITSDIALRRLARAIVAATLLGIGLTIDDITWNLAKIVLLPVSIVSGAFIFTGLFVCAAGIQFFLINAPEFTNSFTYGGSYAAQQPTSVFPEPMKLLFGFVIPVAFTGYLPTIALLDYPSRTLLEPWMAWLTPLATLWVWLIALWLWRRGTRHYQGGGG
jgi:ABC-2 type transport system permease protein